VERFGESGFGNNPILFNDIDDPFLIRDISLHIPLPTIIHRRFVKRFDQARVWRTRRKLDILLEKVVCLLQVIKEVKVANYGKYQQNTYF
jgi:hypothetical protein